MSFHTTTTPTQVLLLGEMGITVLVYLGVRAIRQRRVHSHRLLMLWSLGLNLLLLASFVVVDLARASNTVKRGATAPLWVFFPLLLVHLTIAVSALTIAIISWRIARRGVLRDAGDRVVDLEAEVRRRHRRVSRFYPNLWYATLATGLLLYFALYIAF